jgi:ankyrin repeat protein
MNLNRASSKGDLSAVKKLISDGADVNATDSSGRTALVEAAWGGHNDVVKYLIEKGANVNTGDNVGYTALMRASEEGHAAVVSTLVQKGADVNICGKVRGTTALMLAAEQGHIKPLETLIEHGAKVNAIDQYEETAMARAYRTNQLKAAEYLESKGGRGKPERNTFTYTDKEVRPITKASIPQWSAAANEGGFDDEIIEGASEESFDD